jgi:hypothetical protein
VADIVAIFQSDGIRHRSEFGDEGRNMTGLGVERLRTAFPLSVPPTGVSALMPPHIQGAERRTGRRARRTRWGLRVLVVGGLAGAAWLLTGAAAHAADRTDGPTGSLLGSIVGDGESSPVSGLLTAAAQPLESVSPVHQHHVAAAVLDLPRQVLTRPARKHGTTGHDHAGTPVGAAIGAVDHVLGEVAGPIRLTGGPATTHHSLASMTEPAVSDALPVTDLPPDPAAKPVRPDEEPAPVALAPAAGTPRIAPVTNRASNPIPPTLPAPATAPRVSAPTRHVKVVSLPSVHHRHRVASAIHAPATVSEENPGGDVPAAPLQLHLGDASGTPATSGSGTPTEGGAPAFLPAAIADSTMASHLLPIASDVEVRRHDAEAPTVSPD